MSELKNFDVQKDASSYGYNENKKVVFRMITGISVKHFRSLKERELKLGKHLTIITGKNGTMKTALLGLIAHPFTSPNDAKDIYGKPLKTEHSEIFRLSPDKDKEEYSYYINGITDKDEEIKEPVRIYPRKGGSKFRLTVSATNIKGKGNFLLNTTYINLKRLFPIVETNAKTVHDDLSKEEKNLLSIAYQKIMQRDAYTEIDSISDDKNKNTLGPANAYYDFNSISSGEDNLGHILCKLLAFKRFKLEGNDRLQGLICIDEIEASLHPSSQEAIIQYLLEWAERNNMQIVCTTHSLHIVNLCLKLQNEISNGKELIVINNISTQLVGDDLNYNVMVNPSYKTIYKELTLQNPYEGEQYKVNIICEDELAKAVLKKIIKKKIITQNIEIITDITGTNGTPANSLISLAKNGKRLLEDSVIVVDPDVSDDQISKAKFDFLLKIPSEDGEGFPLEQRVIYYLRKLDGSDEIFVDMEKTAFIKSCGDCGIFKQNYDDRSTKVTYFKSWRNKNKSFFNKALTRYIRDNEEVFSKFRIELVDKINQRRDAKGLRPLEV